MDEFSKLVGGAFLGVCVGLSVQWWKSHRDEVRILCDEFCKTLGDAGDLGAQYWQAPADDKDLLGKEAKLIGLQKRLDGYRVLATGRFDVRSRGVIDIAVAELFDALTGGNFRSPGRAPDPDRMQLAQTKASEAILAVRSGFQEKVHLGPICRRRWTWLKQKCSAAFFPEPR